MKTNEKETYARRKKNNGILQGRTAKKVHELLSDRKFNKTQTKILKRCVRLYWGRSFDGRRDMQAALKLVKMGIFTSERLEHGDLCFQLIGVERNDLDLS